MKTENTINVAEEFKAANGRRSVVKILVMLFLLWSFCLIGAFLGIKVFAANPTACWLCGALTAMIAIVDIDIC